MRSWSDLTTSSTIRNVVSNSLRGGGQGENIVIDARGTTLSLESAQQGVARALGVAGDRIKEITTLAVVDGHGLEDDGGIHFSNYEQQVSFTLPLYAGRLEPVTGRELCRSLALALAAVICEGARAECIVVEELQKILGEFRSEL